MIAANFRRYPEALAAQLCLRFGALIWATKRPGARVLRTIRAARAAAAKRKPHAPSWLPPIAIEPDASLPAWAKAQARDARRLAATVRAACVALFTETRVPVPRLRGRPLWTRGFNYA